MNQQKIAIITGISRGLGRVTADTFVAKGWKVYGFGRSPRPDDLAQVITYNSLDASDADQVEAFVDSVFSANAGAEVCLVNNAGGFIGGSLLEADPEDYWNQMKSCYFASVNTTRSVVKRVEKARIINVISAIASERYKNTSAYGASKAAESYFFQSIRKELDPKSYQITNLYPDTIDSYGSNQGGINANDLANFIHDCASNTKSYYLPEVTLHSI